MQHDLEGVGRTTTRSREALHLPRLQAAQAQLALGVGPAFDNHPACALQVAQLDVRTFDRLLGFVVHQQWRPQRSTHAEHMLDNGARLWHRTHYQCIATRVAGIHIGIQLFTHRDRHAHRTKATIRAHRHAAAIMHTIAIDQLEGDHGVFAGLRAPLDLTLHHTCRSER